jgi:tubulin--tyrosine ligase
MIFFSYRYISNPLLLGGHKFHLRVYILCVGALKVFVFDQILVLIAAHKYDLKDTDNVSFIIFMYIYANVHKY